MFQNLTNNLSRIFDKLKNKGVITEAHLDETLREIRIALLEADVAIAAIKDFIGIVREKALGQDVAKSISPGQMIIKIINDELVNFLKSDDKETTLNLNAKPPVNILMAGLQGSGKTTSAGKLALYLKKQKKRVLLVSLDIYRPAARQQLEIIASKIETDSLAIIEQESVMEIVKRASKQAVNGNYDVVIYDTAGRLHIDDGLIEELIEVKNFLKPTEILLALDSLTGQDAAIIGKKFNDAVSITGVILTRIDGDSRGGAALSIKYVTGAPIKFMGIGEKLEDFEVFAPERIASRILGMGDIVSLVEKAMASADEDEMAKLTKRMEAGKFNLNDYATQLRNIQKIGGFSSIMSMLPGVGKLMKNLPSDKISDKPIKRQIAILHSMTKLERRNPDLLNASRKKRIASGSGSEVSEINRLLKQYIQIASVIKKAKSMDPKSLMRSMPKFF